MPSQKELLGKVKEEVFKAIETFNEKKEGANLDECKRLFKEVQLALNKNDLITALTLAQKAQLATWPTTDFVLSKAKKLEGQGTDAYSKLDFGVAIKSWQDSLKEYNYVIQMASLRGENEILNMVNSTITIIKGNTREAIDGKASYDMNNLMFQAREMVSTAKALYGNGQFDQAIKEFLTAKETYSAAAAIASQFKLEETDQLNKNISEMGHNIETCYYGKASEKLRLALQTYGEPKEMACLEVVKMLETLSSSNPEYINLKKQADRGIIQAQIEVGKKITDEAQRLFNQRDYHTARDSYRKAQEHFRVLKELPTDQKSETQNIEINSLVGQCTESIKTCTENMIKPPDVVDTKKIKGALLAALQAQLDQAKILEGRGTESCLNQDFVTANKLWQDSLKAYQSVRELARQRGELEIAGSVNSAIASVEKKIREAIGGKAHFDMDNLVSQARELTGEGKALFDSGSLEKAIEKFKNAKEKYSSAVTINSDSSLGKAKELDQVKAEIETSIETCDFGTANQKLRKAMQKSAEQKEQACLEVIQILNTLPASNSEYISLKKQANQGIAQARIEVGKKLIDEAQQLSDQRDYPNAIKLFQKAQEHFNNVSEFAIDQQLETEKSEIERLKEHCLESIRTCNKNQAKPWEYAPTPVMSLSDRDKMTRLENELKPAYEKIEWFKPGGANYVGLTKNKAGDQVILRLPKILDANRQKSFMLEWEEWKNLGEQRNIVKLIDAGVFPPLLVLEYVDNGSLSDYLNRNRRVDIKIACRLINDVARGLNYAHSKNVIHGDLKPDNILITKTLEAKITDWSVGKDFSRKYAAPEQYQRQVSNQKTDIYQMGLIFYEMVCGGNPCPSGYVEAENHAKTWNPDRLSVHSTDLEPLDEITLRCLAKDPEKRPTIKEFSQVIYHYMKDQHGESLSVARDLKAQVTELSDLAVMAAKQNEPKDLQDTLKILMQKLSQDMREQLVQELSSKTKNISFITYNLHDSVMQIKANPTFEQQDGIVHETLEITDSVVRMVGHGKA
jgi:serine/threonine protein kinase